MKYDFLVVGAGLFGAIFAYEAKKRGKSVLVIDKRNHIAGNIYTENVDGINVHKYGAHIFHTSNKKVWEYVNNFAEFNNYINAPVAIYKDELYNLPFNMNTFSKLWNIKTPDEAKAIIEKQRKESGITDPKNLEEQAISLVGKDVYEKPIGGYTGIVEKLLEGIEVRTNTEYRDFIKENPDIADKTVYTGMIDEFFDYKLGVLEYRRVYFEDERLDTDNYQGNAVVNYTERDVKFTRIIEHKHFEYGNQNFTIISKEYPSEWQKGEEPYYPINNEKNNALYESYVELSKKRPEIIFGGRLGAYKYYDMDKVVEAALECVEKNL